MYKIACGYNPAFLKDPSFIYKKIQLIELGLFEYKNFLNSNLINKYPLSLHLSRSPIVEDIKSQNKYINHLKKQINPKDFISIGFHLTDRRDSGIGKYGFSSHFYPSKEKIKNAIRFLKKIQDNLGIETWLENANFYSQNISEIKETINSWNEIKLKTNSYGILDISHLIIDSYNSHLRPDFFFGLINWETIIEVHISGIIKSPDGTLHDGHSALVPDVVWKTLNDIQCLLKENIFINIEHTDPIFSFKKKEYNLDFKKLERFSKRIKKKSNTQLFPENYAKSYLKKIITSQIPGLDAAVKKTEYSLSHLIDEWSENLFKKNKRIVLDKTEVTSTDKNIEIASESFLNYLKEKFK